MMKKTKEEPENKGTEVTRQDLVKAFKDAYTGTPDSFLKYYRFDYTPFLTAFVKFIGEKEVK